MTVKYERSSKSPASTGPRDQIKQAAERLFADYGFHRLSLRQLGAAVGLHPGSLYAHFDSKEALLQELIEDGYDDLVESARDCLFRAPQEGALESLACNHLAFRRAHPCWFFLASVERRHLAAAQQSEIHRYEHDYERVFANAMNMCEARNQDRTYAAVRQLLRLLDALIPPEDAPGALPQISDWASDLSWLAVQRLATEAVTAPRRAKESFAAPSGKVIKRVLSEADSRCKGGSYRRKTA